MKTYKQYLNESTYNIKRDVDFLYDLAFKEYVDVMKGKTKGDVVDKNGNIRGLNIKSLRNNIISSEKLKSPDAKKAHKILPIYIHFHNDEGKNFYSPRNANIKLNTSGTIKKMIMASNTNDKLTDTFIDFLGRNKLKSALDQISEKGLKSLIAHELTHWIDDALHNQELSKLSKNFNLKLSRKSTRATYYELNAYIHGVKTRKRLTRKRIWDSWTFDEMLDRDANLAHVKRVLIKNGEYEDWKKRFIKRMHREGLLGKKMR